MRRGIAVLIGLALGATPASATAQTAGGAVTSFGVGDWLSLMLRLGLVVGVIWAAVYAMRWYTRRAGGDGPRASRALDIVETRSLGPNRALHLIRIGGRAVLIGVTPERINALLEIDDPEVLNGLELAGGATSHPAAAFSALLARVGNVSKPAPPTTSATSVTSEATRRAAPAAERLRGHHPISARPLSKRTLADRVLAVLGFTPVGPKAIAEASMLARRRGMPSAPPTAGPSFVPTPRASASSAVPPVASAAQARRARFGYQATRQSSQVESGPAERDARIAEAQRAIADAWLKAG